MIDMILGSIVWLEHEISKPGDSKSDHYALW